MHKLAIIVPTRNRPRLLGILLDSLEAQARRPHQVIVVDGSDEPLENSLGDRPGLKLTYLRVFPPSLTRQRNAGLRSLRDDITLVGYLDDDIVVEPEAIKNLLGFWNAAGDDVGGTSFHITNTEWRPPSLADRLFLLNSRRRGVVLRSGYATSIEPTGEANPSEWLCGGATVWRREIVDELDYDEWFAGAANYEDADFSYQAGKKFKLYVLREARVEHNPPPLDPKKMLHFGEMHVTYRWYFVRKHFGRTFPWFYWATLGAMGTCFVSSLIRWKRAPFYSGLGTMIGLAKVLTGRARGINKEFRKDESHSATLSE